MSPEPRNYLELSSGATLGSWLRAPGAIRSHSGPLVYSYATTEQYIGKNWVQGHDRKNASVKIIDTSVMIGKCMCENHKNQRHDRKMHL